MTTFENLTHFAGFDWAKNHHDIIVVDQAGKVVADFSVEHTAAGWRHWQEKIKAWPQLGVCIETNQGAVVDQLLESGVTVYPINPLSAKRYRERKASSGNKTDRVDAWALADALRLDGQGWRTLTLQDPIVSELRLLSRDEVALIAERTALVNQLQQALREYYPTALEAFDDWCSPFAWAFIESFPDAQTLLKAGKRKWEKWLHAHKLARPETYQRRLEIFAKAGEWQIQPGVQRAKSLLAVSRALQLRTLERQIAEYRKRIQELFSSHPDSGLFGSLPGAGPKLAPRLLSEIGSDRSLYQTKGLQCIAGTAPVSFQSGLIHKVYLRRRCNLFLRSAMYLFADKSRDQCPWAAVYYKQLKKRGKSHSCALRCLGQRWLKIIWKMWQTHRPYDPDFHTKNQLAHGSWVLSVSSTT